MKSNIIVSVFTIIKEILDFIVLVINIKVYFELQAEKKRIKSKKRYKKRVPSRIKHY